MRAETSSQKTGGGLKQSPAAGILTDMATTPHNTSDLRVGSYVTASLLGYFTQDGESLDGAAIRVRITRVADSATLFGVTADLRNAGEVVVFDVSAVQAVEDIQDGEFIGTRHRHGLVTLLG